MQFKEILEAVINELKKQKKPIMKEIDKIVQSSLDMGVNTGVLGKEGDKYCLKK